MSPPTLIWLYGAEHGVSPVSVNGAGLCDFIGGTPTVSNTVYRSGAYSLRCNTVSATGCYIAHNISGSPTVLIGSLFIRLGAYPGSNDLIIPIYVTTGYTFTLTINSSTHKIASGIDGTFVQYVDTALSLDTWYRIDFKVTCGSNPHTFDWQLDGTAATQITNAVAASSIYRMYLGSSWSATRDIYYDDVVLSVTSADYPIGAHRIEPRSPSSDGTHNNAAGVLQNQSSQDINGSTITAFDLVGSVPLSETSEFIRCAAAGGTNYVEVNFEDTSQTSIWGAMAYLSYMSATATGNNGACIIIDEDTTQTTLWGNPTTRADYSENSLFYKSVLLPTPSGGWDQGAVNALKCRLGYSSDATPDPYWENLLLEVAYAEVTGTEYPQSVSGGLTPAGALLKESRKIASGSLTSVGALLKDIRRSLIGALGSGGALAKMLIRALIGSIASSSVLSSTKIALKELIGNITPSGILLKRANKLSIGSLSSSGILITVSSFFRSIGGNLTSTGALVKRSYKVLVGSVLSSGTLTMLKSYLRSLSGAISSTGSLIKTDNKMVSGILSSGGVVIRNTTKSLLGSLASLGALSRKEYRELLGVISSSGTLSIAKAYLRLLTGSLSSTGILTKSAGKTILASLAPTGIIIRSIRRSLDAVISPVGSLAKKIARELSSILSSIGVVIGSNPNPPVPTPLSRTLFTRSESRSLFIEGANRVLEIQADNRSFFEKASSRVSYAKRTGSDL